MVDQDVYQRTCREDPLAASFGGCIASFIASVFERESGLLMPSWRFAGVEACHVVDLYAMQHTLHKASFQHIFISMLATLFQLFAGLLNHARTAQRVRVICIMFQDQKKQKEGPGIIMKEGLTLLAPYVSQHTTKDKISGSQKLQVQVSHTKFSFEVKTKACIGCGILSEFFKFCIF